MTVGIRLESVCELSPDIVPQCYMGVCSMTEIDIASGIMVGQDMLYIYHLLESLELKVEFSYVA